MIGFHFPRDSRLSGCQVPLRWAFLVLRRANSSMPVLTVSRPGRPTIDRSRINPGHHSRHPAPILAVFGAESLLQLSIFKPDHEGACNHREQGQGIANRQSGSHAPGQHLAQVSQIDRMAHPGAYSRSDQALFGMSGDKFRKPTELCGAESGSGAPVNSESSSQDQGGGQPAPCRGVEWQASPPRGGCRQHDPHRNPERYQEAIGRTPPCAPILGAGVDAQPECWDGGVHDARQPPDSAE